MRIAHLTVDWQSTGGVSSYVRLLVAAQLEAGHDVQVIHAAPPITDEAVVPRLSVVSCVGALRRGADAATQANVIEALGVFRPDLVHVHACDDHATEQAIRQRWPALKTLHNLFFCPAGTKYHAVSERVCTFKTGLACVPRQAYLRCTTSKRPNIWWDNYRNTVDSNHAHRQWRQLVVTSEYVRQQAIANDFDGDRIAVVPYFTTLPEAPPPVSTRRVLFVGRTSREKGAHIVLQAVARLPQTWTAVIIGDGIDMAYVRRTAADLGITDRVEFPGWLTGDALDDQYRRAAVVVVPSLLAEPFGISGIEGLAWARPVVAFDVGGIPGWLEDGIGGFLVPAGDVAAMSQRIGELLDQPETAAIVAARGRARAEREFSAAAHLARLDPLYQDVIARGI